jgi:hypothetical protein
MSAEDLDLSEDWQLLQPERDVLKQPRFHNLDAMQKAIERKAIDHTLLACDRIPGVSKEALERIVSRSVKTSLSMWTMALDEQGTEGLLEYLLLGASLTEAELVALLRSMPMSLLDRILASASKSATGLHALISLEWHRRNGGNVQYRIDHQGQVLFTDPKHGEIGFYLDESIKTDG